MTAGIRIQQAALATDPTFFQAVRASALATAAYVKQEASDAPDHDLRLVMSNAVFRELVGQDADAYLIKTFCWLAAMNGDILAACVVNGVVHAENLDDTLVDYVVGTYWNQLAAGV